MLLEANFSQVDQIIIPLAFFPVVVAVQHLLFQMPLHATTFIIAAGYALGSLGLYHVVRFVIQKKQSSYV